MRKSEIGSKRLWESKRERVRSEGSKTERVGEREIYSEREAKERRKSELLTDLKRGEREFEI